MREKGEGGREGTREEREVLQCNIITTVNRRRGWFSCNTSCNRLPQNPLDFKL